MIDTIGIRGAALMRDLVRARAELNEANSQQKHKDSPAHREAVIACLAQMDAVLDRYLLVQQFRP